MAGQVRARTGGGGSEGSRRGPAGSWHGVGSVKARCKTRDRAGSRFRRSHGRGPGRAEGGATLICWGCYHTTAPTAANMAKYINTHTSQASDTVFGSS